MLPNAVPDHIQARLADYARLLRVDRPIGSLLLLWPTYWALWLAADGFPSTGNFIVFTLGVFMMRAAGCAINDFADRKVDRHVKRTKDRPLTSGRIEAWEAVALFAGLCLTAFLMVVLFTNTLTLYLSFGGAVLAFIYPFMKRYTYYPQVVLGAAYSWGILMCFTAERGSLPPEAWLLFVANVVWTVAYDTYYAMADREDDLKIGIKSTAILFGEADRVIIATLQGLALFCLVLAGVRFELGQWFHLGLVVAAACFAWEFWKTRSRQPQVCFKAFLHNHWAGLAILAGIVLDYATKAA